MTPEEYVRDAMRSFKEAKFDPIAVGWIERAMVRAIAAAVAEEREANERERQQNEMTKALMYAYEKDNERLRAELATAVQGEREACAVIADKVNECFYEHGSDCKCTGESRVVTQDIGRMIRER